MEMPIFMKFILDVVSEKSCDDIPRVNGVIHAQYPSVLKKLKLQNINTSYNIESIKEEACKVIYEMNFQKSLPFELLQYLLTMIDHLKL